MFEQQSAGAVTPAEESRTSNLARTVMPAPYPVSNWRPSRKELAGLLRGRGEEISRDLISEECFGTNVPCPVCSGRDRSSYNRRTELWYCRKCDDHSRDTISMIVAVWLDRGATVAQAFNWIYNWLRYPMSAIPHRSNKPRPTRRNKFAAAEIERMLRSAKPIGPGNQSGKYVMGRGLEIDWSYPPANLHHHDELPYWFSGTGPVEFYPGMVAAVQDPTGRVVALHRTFLDGAGGKALVPSPKKITKPIEPGATNGAAVRLYEPTDILQVAEGIEDAIAAYLLTSKPTWSALSAGGLARFIVPEEYRDRIKQIRIMADRDQVGVKAARDLAARLDTEGFRVEILAPDVAGADVLDCYLSLKERGGI